MDLTPYQNPEVIQRALAERRVAVVGMSSNELRASNFVGYYLLRHGYEVVPVNPRETEVYGQTCYPSLDDVPQPVGVVDVFRDPSAVPDIARQAVAMGAKFLWLQFGVVSRDGIRIAEAGGLTVIADRCIKIEHARYRGRMHWLGFNRGTLSSRRNSAD
ncbi:MAG: CoA-binding protein [Pseudomonadales bacterium]|jgi:predicted CoA-binding protein